MSNLWHEQMHHTYNTYRRPAACADRKALRTGVAVTTWPSWGLVLDLYPMYKVGSMQPTLPHSHVVNPSFCDRHKHEPDSVPPISLFRSFRSYGINGK